MKTPNSRLYGARWSLPLFIIGALASVFAAYIAQQGNDRHIRVALQHEASRQTERIRDRLNLYQYGLRGMRGAIIAAGDTLNRNLLTRYEYSRDIDREFPGARGFGFIRRVPRNAEDKFVAAARADGWPDFTIKQLAAHDDERFVVQYLEPIARNRKAIGFDIASEINRRTAALTAMHSDAPILTEPITLVQDPQKPGNSFLFLLPIYREAPATAVAREASCIGWSFTPLVMSEVIAALRMDENLFHLELRDVTKPGQTRLFYATTNGMDIDNSFQYAEKKTVFGRQWQFTYVARPVLIKRLNLINPAHLLIFGVLLSALIAGYTGTSLSSRQRRREILSQQQHLAAIVTSSNDAIIAKSLDDIVTTWNKGAELLFGYAAGEAIGKKLVDLIVPPKLALQEEVISQRIARDESIQDFETQRRRRDGRLVDVSITISPIHDETGQVIGASTTARDISVQKAFVKQALALNTKLGMEAAENLAHLDRLNHLFGEILRAASQVSIIAADCAGLITVFNTGAENMLGYKAEEIIGKHTPDIFHDDAEVTARSAELSREYGTPIEGFRVFVHKPEVEGAETREWTYVRKDQSRFVVSLSVNAMRDKHGNITGYVGIAVDITQRKVAEVQLADALALSQAVLNTAVNPIITFDAKGILRSFNPAAEKTFGYAASEVIGRNVNMLRSVEIVGIDDYLARFNERKLAHGIGFTREAEGKRADGSVFPVQISLGGMEVRGERLIVGILSDMSEYDHQRKALIEARDQLQLAVETAELGIWMRDIQQKTMQVNDRMFELYQFPPGMRTSGIDNTYWRSLIHPDDLAETEALLLAAMRDKQRTLKLMFRVLRPDGTMLHIHASHLLERDANQEVFRITCVNRDVTAQIEYETALREAKQAADMANQAKSAFLANMSHEIRTPMNAVLGMLQLASHTELNPRQRDYIDKARIAAHTLLELLNDILDFSKIEAGKLLLDLQPFSIEQLLRDLAVMLTGNLADKPVEMIYDLDGNLPDKLIGDSLRLRQVLINLAGNALKFTAEGHVIIKLARLDNHDSRDDRVRLRISVIDSGIGISPEWQRTIFDSFNQADASISRRFGGTGLGLAICQRLIHVMGGELQLISEPGQGSHFWFDLELPIADTRPLIPPSAEPLRVLVVDDNTLIAAVLVRTVKSLGWSAHYVTSGAASIAEVRTAQARSEPYHVVLMDWRMPDLNGCDAAQLIRALPGNDAPVIIMITAYGRETLAAEQQHGNAPFADFLTKPVTPQELAETVLIALQESSLHKHAHTDDFQPRLSGMHVLVIEDNALNRQVAEELLEREGAVVALAVDGIQGIVQVQSMQPPFDAVIMDMQMPVIDGLEATRRIRANSRFAHLPILAMTANASASDREACLEAGMNDHIGKPIDVEQMVAALLRLTAGGDTPTPPSTATDNTESAAPTQPLTAILPRFGGHLAVYKKMFAQFKTDAHGIIGQLHDCATRADSNTAAMLLHSLKGSAATIGATALSTQAALLEQVSKEQKAVNIEALTELLQHSCKILQTMLDHVDTSGDASTPAALTTAQWRAKLEEILPLLEANNMRALDLIEALPETGLNGATTPYQSFRAQALALNFTAAAHGLRDCLSKL